MERAVSVRAADVELGATLGVPESARATVLFAHGSGSSRRSPRNRAVAAVLHEAGFATLLMDLLTAEEEDLDARTGDLRFDVDLLAQRLVAAVAWLAAAHAPAPFGTFGASTGAAAALVAAAQLPGAVRAVVSRGGRPDLAGGALASVEAPTLLIVGGLDAAVLDLNREAMSAMRAPVRLEIVEGATHLFEEPGALDRVAVLARDWFATYLA